MNKKAVSIMEYSMIMVAVVAALLGIQIYLKRAISGRWRQSSDTFGFGRQYDAPNLKLFVYPSVGKGKGGDGKVK